MNHRQTEEFISINDLWRLYVCHWHWFAISLTLCMGYALFYLVTTPDMYSCEAAILVKDESMGKNATRNLGGEEFNDIGLLKQGVNITNVQRQLASLEVLAEVAMRITPGISQSDAILMAEDMALRLKSDIDNEKSTIINLKFVDFSLAQAEHVLSTIIQVYNEKWLEDKNMMTAATSSFISERLQLLERELSEVDDSISAFKERNQITDIERVSDMYLEKQSQSDAEILRLTNQKAMAQYILGILEDTSKTSQLLPTNSGINNSVAEAQITQYNNMLLQLKKNMYGTSKQNPLILRQEAELKEVRQSILSTIDNQIKTLDIQLQALQGYNGEASSRISSNPNQAKHLVSVEREQKVKESLYLYLLQKKEENEINMTYTSNITRTIDMPHGSEIPSSPNKSGVLFAAVLMGLLFPGVFLFVREVLDNTVRDKYDVEHNTSLTLIGEVPLCVTSRSKRMFIRQKPVPAHPIVVGRDKQDIVNEAFRLIRSNLEFMMGRSGEKNVYILTSFYEGSGKTFIGINLAITLAIKEWHVLLIDGDFRHATASRCFGQRETGIADYLGYKENDIDRLLIHHAEYPTLDILPVGTPPPNPTELLSTPRLEELLQRVRTQYDFILIDCPPTELLADATIIEQYADRTLFVVRAGLFERKFLHDLENDAASGKFKNTSVVLNATNLEDRYGYRKGYRYGG